MTEKLDKIVNAVKVGTQLVSKDGGITVMVHDIFPACDPDKECEVMLYTLNDGSGKGKTVDIMTIIDEYFVKAPCPFKDSTK